MRPSILYDFMVYENYDTQYNNKFDLYTERQKKHHFSRETFTEIHCIKINHIWIQISYSTPYQAYLKQKGWLCKKSEKCGKITGCT